MGGGNQTLIFLLGIHRVTFSNVNDWSFNLSLPPPALKVKLSMETSPIPRIVSVALLTIPIVVAMSGPCSTSVDQYVKNIADYQIYCDHHGTISRCRVRSPRETIQHSVARFSPGGLDMGWVRWLIAVHWSQRDPSVQQVCVVGQPNSSLSEKSKFTFFNAKYVDSSDTYT